MPVRSVTTLLSDKEKELRAKELRKKVRLAASPTASESEIETLIKSRSHAVVEALLANLTLTSQQIEELTLTRVDFETQEGEWDHRRNCLMLVLKHPNTPESVLIRISKFSRKNLNHRTQGLFFSHPNCTESLLDEWLHAEYGRMRPYIASSPNITEAQARSLIRDTNRRDESEKSSLRWRDRVGGPTTQERLEQLDRQTAEAERECHVNLAKNPFVSLDVVRIIDPTGNPILLSSMAARFQGAERERLLDQFAVLAPSGRETQMTIAKLSSDPEKLAELCLSKYKTVLWAVAENPATKEEDKVLLALLG
jgi:hypothetical protein